MLRLAPLSLILAGLCAEIACQPSSSSGGAPQATIGGGAGTGGATGESGAAGAAGSGSAVGGGGAGAVPGGGGRGEVAAGGTNAGGGYPGAAGGATNGGDGGIDTSGGGRNGAAGRGGTGPGGRGGGNAGAVGGVGGAGGRTGQVETCPFTSAESLIWPGPAPGGAGVTVVETRVERSTNPLLPDRMVSGVTKPSLLPFLAQRPNGAAAVVVPGGGYRYLEYDKEGTEIAAWLNSLGVSAFVLKYRLPLDFPASTWVALADAQRAMRVIRMSAAACKIDPARIGVIGFSAGGHLASQLETRFTFRPTPATDDVDALDARPGFSVLMYPVVSMDPAIAHAGSKAALLGATPTAAAVALASSELQVTRTTPPTFIGTSLRDTTVNPDNSVRFDNALIAAGVAQELHLYKDGAHGTGIRGTSGDMAAWPMQCATWLTARNLLSGPVP